MSKKSYRQAINEALRQEMERDHRVILMGEDVSGGTGTNGDQDAWGGPLGVTKGLRPKFGPDRVLELDEGGEPRLGVRRFNSNRHFARSSPDRMMPRLVSSIHVSYQRAGRT